MGLRGRKNLRASNHRVQLSHRQPRTFAEPLERRVLLSSESPAVELFGVSPALFVENQGQWADESIRYIHQGNGANVLMTDSGPVIDLFRREASDDADTEADPLDRMHPRFEPDDSIVHTTRISAGFVGADPVRPVGLQQSQAAFNYFIGDESNWRTNVPGYEIVAYQGLYDGIDLHTWGLRSNLKYEFHVAPGGDHTQIQVRYDGIEGLSLADDGALLIDLGDEWGQLRDDPPYVYQLIEGQQVQVAAKFLLLDDVTYGFDVGAYDASRVLIIDPDLAWATYLGGSASDSGYGIAVDGAGNALVTGYTRSSDFSGANNTYKGGYDAFVAKISSSGSLQWATYLGGSGDDQGSGIAVDGAGNALVTGYTYSSDFSGANNAFKGGEDPFGRPYAAAFMAKVSYSGSLQWATYLGGSGDDVGYGIAVDAAGNALVSGSTSSRSFSGANNAFKGGSYDAFVAKVSSSGSLQWATYLGGSGWDDGDRGYGIAVDGAGNALVTGYTESTDFSGANNAPQGYTDAFVAKVSYSGSLQWATYLGGSDSDGGSGIAVDGTGNVLITGGTSSSNFSGANNAYKGVRDAFVAKIYTLPSGIWDGDAGDGLWNTAANWSNDVLPTSADDVYIILPGTYTVALSGTTAPVNSLTLGGASGTQTLIMNTDLTLAEASTLSAGDVFQQNGGTLSGGGDLTVNGTFDWIGGAMSGTGETIIASGATLNVFGSGARTSSRPLRIDGHASVETGGDLTIVLSSLTVGASGKLDLNDNALIVDGGSYSAIETLVIQGYNNGDWLGNGITSSAAANDTNFVTALGIASNANLNLTEFAGATGLNGDEILVRYTYYGDADLGGTVNLDDFGQFLFGFNPANAADQIWLNGDFNFSGAVNLDDFNLFLFGLQNQASAQATAPLFSTKAVEPEPIDIQTKPAKKPGKNEAVAIVDSKRAGKAKVRVITQGR